MAVLLWGTAACYPIWLGNRLEDRVETLDNATRENRAQQDETRRNLGERIDELDGTLDRMTKSATRTTAEVAASTDDLVRKVQLLRGELEKVTWRFEEVSQRFEQLERRVAALGGEDALRKLEAKQALGSVERPTDKQKFFDLAKGHHDRGDYATSRMLFQEFIEKWKFDDLAPQAQLLVGDSLVAEKKHRAAVLEYQKVREVWPKSRFLPDALYKLGLSFLELGLAPEGTTFLEEAAKYPGQQAGKDAKAKLTELSKNKNKKK
ncbi:TPR repeat containing exported protein [Vulgatibacter incomptus]|uniref:TPR repeat containing exported protein n=1 Tax=Vulgatibacter incomptus TaxID=1391653 RepID=A0A0K1PEG5_9BACT|nr:TPR repeat containing exported protein [Vulgatibacter incomptus]